MPPPAAAGPVHPVPWRPALVALTLAAFALAGLAAPVAADHPPEYEEYCNLHDDYPSYCVGQDGSGRVCIFYDPGSSPPTMECVPA